MDYLTIVQNAIEKAGVREDSPSTLVSAEGIVSDFKTWANDSWVDLQNESVNWFFRRALDQTFTISLDDDDYSMPSGIQTILWRTVTTYTTAKTDESFVKYIPYIEWRTYFDTRTMGKARPQFITRAQSAATDELLIAPVPDKTYTLRFDAVNDIDEMSANTDVPTGLPTEFHNILVYDTIQRYARHHEDGAKLADSQERFLKYRTALGRDQLPEFHLHTSTLYGTRPRLY